MPKSDLDDWVVIYRTNQAYMVEIVQAVLKDNGIESVVINKKDSTYLFGDIELYVRGKDEIFSKLIIEKNDL